MTVDRDTPDGLSAPSPNASHGRLTGAQSCKLEDQSPLLDSTLSTPPPAQALTASVGVWTSTSNPNAIPDAYPAKTRPCILKVDDDAFNFELIESTFNADFLVLFAPDGPAALEIASELTPDLILLDVIMPGMDGTNSAAG